MKLINHYCCNLNFFLSIVVLTCLTSCKGYTVKNHHVYYVYWNEGSGRNERLLEHADAASFSVLDNSEYGKDKFHVYNGTQIIPGADPSSFTLIDDYYAKDKYRGYFCGDSIATSTAEGFTVINSYYAKDLHDVYYTTSPLHVCHPGNFKYIGPDDNLDLNSWSTDGCHYFYMQFKIPSEDYAHTRYFLKGGGMAADLHYVYFLDHAINYDIDGKKVMDTVDVNSFKVTGFLECRDKFGCINPYHGREACP